MSCDPSDTIEVWLVEDNRTFSRGLIRALGSSDGIRCGSQFSNAEDLLRTLQKSQPDVLLLDIQLPGMDGLTALGEIRTLYPHMQTLVLTAFDDDDKIFRAICSGASGYLLKSANQSEIGNAVKEVAAGGAPMTPKVAKRVIERFASASPPAGKTEEYSLTDREVEILRLMANGLIKKEIADHLEISTHTVNTHIRSIYDKLHVNTNTGAVAKALREDLI